MDATALIDECRKMAEALERRLPSIGLALVAIAVAALVARVVARMVARLIDLGSERFGRNPYLATVLARLARLAVMIAGTLIALTIAFPSFTTANLVQLLGISSVAIGFAFRDIFQNFLAGLLLLITRPFRIGDQIAFLNEEGTVEDIQTRATLIRTYDGRRVVIPNANLFTSPVIVNTAFPSRRMELDFDCPPERDVERLREAVRGS